jgi:hypothetical protein
LLYSDTASRINSVVLGNNQLRNSMGNPSNMLLNDVSNDSSLILDDIDVKHDPSAHMMIGNLNPGGNKNFK